MTRFRAVAWDIDGTLVDSEALHHRALLAASAAFGIDLSDLPDQAFRGVHILDVWDRLGARMQGGASRDRWLAAIDRHYVEHRAGIAPMPEAKATTLALSARGVRQVCVSNSGRAIVDANIEALGVKDIIAFSISLDDVAAGKPDPAPYRQACERLGVAPDKVVAVEDSLTGARSATDAGLYVVGYAPNGERFGRCDRWIGGLSEILELFAE